MPRRLRTVRSVISPTSCDAPIEIRRTYQSWTNLQQLHKRWSRRKSNTPQPVDASWLKSFDAFHADMGTRPEGMSLARHDTSLPYRSDNCYWVSPSDLPHSLHGRTPRLLTCGNRSLTIRQWSAETGLTTSVIYGRLQQGHSASVALGFEPLPERRKAASEPAPASPDTIDVGPDEQAIAIESRGTGEPQDCYSTAGCQLRQARA